MESNDLNWEECKKAFHKDGSYRDIYVHNISIADWDKFLVLTESLKTNCFANDEPVQFPPRAAEIFKKYAETMILMKIYLGKIQLNCHFFREDEIELDIDPAEITSQQDLDIIVEFITNIGNALEKDVFLTDENGPELRWFIFEHSTSVMKFVGG